MHHLFKLKGTGHVVERDRCFGMSLTHNLLLDITYEPYISKKSPDIWQILLIKIKTFIFLLFVEAAARTSCRF